MNTTPKPDPHDDAINLEDIEQVMEDQYRADHGGRLPPITTEFGLAETKARIAVIEEELRRCLDKADDYPDPTNCLNALVELRQRLVRLRQRRDQYEFQMKSQN